jgi:hypothetical protein
MSARPASSGEYWTLSQSERAYATISAPRLSTSARVMPSLRSMWMSDTDSTMWICGVSASLIAPQTASMSSRTARASAVTVAPRISRAIWRQAWKSPGDEIGKPASITSTPSFSSW